MSSESAADWKNKGNAFLSSGQNAEAIEAYTKAIELDGSQHVFYSNRSAAYLSNQQPELALSDAEQCIKIKPDWVKGYSRKGAALHSSKQYELAIEAYEQGLKLDSANAACNGGIEEVRRAMAPSGGNPLAGAFGPDMFGKLATNPRLAPYLSDPEFVKKLQDIQADPSKMSQHLQDPRMMTVLGELMGLNMNMAPGAPGAGGGGFEATNKDEYTTPKATTANSTKQAEEESSKMEVDESSFTEEEKEQRKKDLEASAAKQEGNAHYKKKEFEQAISCYDKAIHIDPSNMSYLSNRAAVRFEMKNYTECIKDCEDAINIGRENRADYALIAKAFVRIGNAYLKLGEDEENVGKAIQAYENAQVENRTKAIDQKIKATTLKLKKAKALAYIDPEKALKAKEEGNVKFKAGDFPGAVELYSEAIKRDPENAVYYANRAATYTKLTCFNDAKSDCDKALELDPKYVKAYSRKGAILFFMKEYHKALECYQKGLDIDPQSVECKEGYQRVVRKIQEDSATGEVDQERAAHGMADPEIQAILRDPVIQNILRDFSENPAAAQKHLQNPGVMAKIEKLIAAGVLQTK